MDISKADLGTAYDLLRKYSTLHAVSDYLDRHNVNPSSVTSWPQFFENRLLPALQRGALNRGDLVKMIREAEEHGKQHIFLYTVNRSYAATLLSPATLTTLSAKMGLQDLLEKARIVDESKGLELVDIRIDDDRKGTRSVVMKAVDVRVHKKQVAIERVGNRETVTYEYENDRAVNLLVVRSDGLVEARIQSYKNALDYEKEAGLLFDKAAGILDTIKLVPLSLTRARIKLVNERKKYAHLVRFADNQLRDKEGRTYTVSTATRQQDLYAAGSATEKSLEAFLSVGTPACDEIDCFWVRRNGVDVPSTEIHTLIMGADNEFAVTAHCTRKDYEYVLSNIVHLTR